MSSPSKEESSPESMEGIEQEETEIESQEERLAREKEEQLQQDIQQTLLRVQFSKPKVKDIISHHSGSILANDEPKVPWSQPLENQCRTAYNTATQQRTLPLTMELLVDILEKCSFVYFSEALRKYLHLTKSNSSENDTEKRDISSALYHAIRLFSTYFGDETKLSTLEEDDIVKIIQKFIAPPFYYGQRLRKYASRGQTSNCLELLYRGCDPNTADGEGLSSLHYVCEYNRPELIILFHDVVGSNLLIDGKDKFGWTPLHCACHNGNVECVKILLNFGANVNAQNLQGKTPSHLAAAQGRNLIVDLLREHGANTNLLCLSGMNALHDAARNGHRQLFNTMHHTEAYDDHLKDYLNYQPSEYLDLVPLH